MKRTLLIAEDERREVNFLVAFVDKYFLQEIEIVAVCRDGSAACEKAIRLHPDIVFLDIEMPGMNGLKAAELIKQEKPDTVILLLTAHGLFQYARQAIKIGVHDYLVKPYLDEELREAVTRILAQFEEKERLDREKDDHPAKNKVTAIVSLALNYIEKHYFEDISLNQTAACIGISAGHLGKCFKQDMEVSFNDYLAQYRIERAKELFAKRYFSAAEVASMVGFSDPNYFYKCFKKYVGVPPKTYASKLF